MGNPAAPLVSTLAVHGALFTGSYAITHPSQPNYLALFSGGTQGVTDDSSAFTRSRRVRRSDSCGRRLIGSLRGDSISADGEAHAGTVRPYVLHWRYG
jgi:phosphatidylinositol-3-phosphatase